jgi:hypothetical protein
VPLDTCLLMGDPSRGLPGEFFAKHGEVISGESGFRSELSAF